MAITRYPQVILGLALLGLPALAENPPVASPERTRLLQSQIKVLEGRAADQYSNPVAFDVSPIVIPGTPEARQAATNGSQSRWIKDAEQAAARAGVPVPLFLSLVTRESGWNPAAVSPKGARGLAQLMPATARLLRVKIDDPIANLNGGARYLRMMYDRFGRWDLALAAYNAGPEAVARHGSIPPYAETRAYVAAILNR